MDWEAGDRELLKLIDEELEHKARLAGAHLVCRPGCTECCIGPFAINQLDVLRLKAGLAALEGTDPARARAIIGRANEQIQQYQTSYPGDSSTGALSGDEESRTAFLEANASVPCPVLNPGTGLCDLYSSRPVSCRTFGLPVRFGDELLEPCRLCFTQASPAMTESCRSEPDPGGLEDALLAQIERGAYNEETIVAFAVGRRGREAMKEITAVSDLEQVFAQPVAVVFKHSARCPISRNAQREVESFLAKSPGVPVYLVDVVRDNTISKAVATRTGIRHESPQTIVLSGGSVAWHGSHYQVTADAIRSNLP